MHKERLLLYGTGDDFTSFIRMKDEYPDIYYGQIIGAADSSPDKIGKSKYGIQIRRFENYSLDAWDKIIITSQNYFSDIKDNLVRNHKINPALIYSIQEYIESRVVYYQYHRNITNNLHTAYKNTRFSSTSLVVYTGIFGQYDTLKDPTVIDPGVKYVCYTDQRDLHSDVWDIRYINDSSNPKALLTRQIKLLTHRFFPEYETSIWIDATFQITGSLVELISKYQKSADFLLFPHQERFCIYDEAAACMRYYKERKDKIVSQITKYKSEGYPFNNGLFYGGFLVRNHNVEAVKKTMDDWYYEVEHSSFRDQLSLPYVLAKNALPIDLCDLNVMSNKWIKYYKHF